MNIIVSNHKSIVLKSAQLGRSIRDPADLKLELGRVEEKTGEEKTQCDPATLLQTR